MPQLVLKSSRKFLLAIKHCQQTIIGKVINLSRSSLKKSVQICTHTIGVKPLIPITWLVTMVTEVAKEIWARRKPPSNVPACASTTSGMIILRVSSCSLPSRGDYQVVKLLMRRREDLELGLHITNEELTANVNGS
jgi:hypothetical protein